jgi:hypothetical protein
MKSGIVAMQFLRNLDPLKVHMLLNGLNQGLKHEIWMLHFKPERGRHLRD